MLLAGRVALITGAGRGIGREIALKLAAEGADVAVADLTIEAAAEVAKEIEALGVKSLALKVDVSSPEDALKMVKDTVDAFGRLDILVNNAGITKDKLMLRMEESDWDAVLSVNLKGAFNCTKAAVRVMAKARYGRVVNIASIVGLIGNAGQANYSASKAGLIGLTKTTAREFASRSITCNAIAPGFIDTAMTQAMPEKARDALTAQIPLARLGSSEDVAEGVLFLASDKASYITGHVLSINGGMYM
ncbi:3-oxoacyl-[acyl-carrier protein] reductase [hydrothermal vent metagenome]|uniref:3-oxoacyl-[acyl-carrier protein] reductase n=1 Tax=hydrothermal vent metagenome TaxID=652676 RepID=A0A3B0RB34_9ZZZZ